MLGPDLTPLAVGGDLPADALNSLLAQDDSKQALDEAVQNDAVVTAAMPGDDHLRLAFVPASPAQFKTQDVYGLVRRGLTETGLEPERLELEITADVPESDETTAKQPQVA